MVVTAGQLHESQYLEPLLDSFALPRSNGYVKTRPRAVAADKAYDSKALRDYLRRRGIRCVIPERKRAVRKPGRPRVLDKGLYRQRNVVERAIGWLKQCRRIATRYEKRRIYFEGMLQLACIRLYLKRIKYLSDTT